jgi:hypothetical protein
MLADISMAVIQSIPISIGSRIDSDGVRREKQISILMDRPCHPPKALKTRWRIEDPMDLGLRAGRMLPEPGGAVLRSTTLIGVEVGMAPQHLPGAISVICFVYIDLMDQSRI